MDIREDIEKLEKKSFDYVWQSIPKDQNFYLENFSQLTYKELYLYLSRQTVGRSKNYKYDLTDLIENNRLLTKDRELELRSRIAASSNFSKAFERIINMSLISSFVTNQINFTLNLSPNSSSFSAFLELKDTSTQINTEKIKGVLLNVDTNSINGYSNLGDALAFDYFGKFNLGLNQTTYNPPMLRQALQESENTYLSQKYSTLDGYKLWKNKSYIVVTIFVTVLSCLPNDRLFSDELKDISGNHFNHHIMCTCIPHMDLISEYYDHYFGSGKGGKEKGYPRNYRFQIYNENEKFLKFRNLKENEYRFKFVNENGEYDNFGNSNGISQKKFKIYSP